MEAQIRKDDPYKKAIAFYILNKTGFSGLTEKSGSISKGNYANGFTVKKIEKLRMVSEMLQGVNITNVDFEEVIKASKNKRNNFIFLDPPYMIEENLYGNKKSTSFHEEFDHERFCKVISECNSKWLITYNDNKILREWFKDFDISVHTYKYTMAFQTNKDGEKSSRIKTELMIKNY